MTRLIDQLIGRIRANGPMTIAEYMAEALGHPELGYYRHADPLGRGGDFITAPEISQMFGELIGLWLVDAWERLLGAPARLDLVELGPGRGTLMADALRAAALRPAFIAALDLHLVEINQALVAHQERSLAPWRERLGSLRWHESLASLPPGPFMLVANEFFDALPIRQYERRHDGWAERRVGLSPEGAGLAFTLGPEPVPIQTVPTQGLPAGLDDAPLGSVVEIGEAAQTIAHALAHRLMAVPGLALIIDYGTAATQTGDSLQAVRGHRFADPLAAPGLADLTAHVDFAALARAAGAGGARTHGPIAQGDFLRALGIAARAERLSAGAAASERTALAAACRRLIDPQEMGTLFKVLALASPGLPAPAGFPHEA